MKHYNKKSRCVKCGERDINSTYHAEWQRGCPREARDSNSEHICRFCRNCKYEWAELALNGNFNKGHNPEDFTEGKIVNVYNLPPFLENPVRAQVVTNYFDPRETIHLRLLNQDGKLIGFAKADYKQCEIIE